jgi:hypothetical protein
MKTASGPAEAFDFLEKKFSIINLLFRFYVQKKRGRSFPLGSNAL